MAQDGAAKEGGAAAPPQEGAGSAPEKTEPVVCDEAGIPVVAGVPTDPDAGNWGPLLEYYVMPVTSSGPSPADLVNRGFYQILLFRSPQATRHFLAALSQDPECALAWVGLYLSLLERGMEMQPVRAECLRKVLPMRARVMPHEVLWIDAIRALDASGVREFAAKLNEIREASPDEHVAAAMLPLMLREGYDETGVAKAGQAAAEALLAEMLKDRPDDPVVLHAWIEAMLVGPRPQEAREEAVRLLAGDVPSAYLRQAAGMLLFRCGDTAAAVDAFDQARVHEEKSLRAEGISVSASPTYFDNLSCLAMALVEAGRREQALIVARAAGKIALPCTDLKSTALREYAFWSLPMESLVYARCGEWKKAIAAMPAPDHAVFKAKHPSGFFTDALLSALQSHEAVQRGDLKAGRAYMKHLERLMAGMAKMAEKARMKGFDPHWTESRQLLEFVLYDVRAGVSFLGGDTDLADIWWSSAAERTVPGTVRAVPRWPRSAWESKAETYQRAGGKEKQVVAVKAWEKALEVAPKSGWAVSGLHGARLASGDKEGADKARQGLQTLWPGADASLLKLRASGKK